MTVQTSDPVHRPPHTSAAPAGGSVALLVATGLLVVSAAVQPHVAGGSDTARLAGLHAAGMRAVVSTVCFVVAQLPLAVGLVAVGSLLRPGSPRLARGGVGLAVVGAYGEAVSGGVSLVLLVMAADTVHRSWYADLAGQLRTSPLGIFALLGLAGSVIGLLLLSIGIFRSRVAPRWVGPALWVFLVLEYAGSVVVPALGYVGVAAGAAAFVALARAIRATSAAR